MPASRLLLALGFSIHGTISVSALPNGYAWGCLNVSKSFAFCDARLPADERAKDLVDRLTVKEKIGLLGPDTRNTVVAPCDCLDAGVERLGLPRYMNLVETNSAVASSCLGSERCATTFPGPLGVAASFNRTAWRRKGEAISTEMRAFNTLNWFRGLEQPDSLIGLTGFGPNINIARDPRFGRVSELPGEDPILSGVYAMEYVKGMQEGPDERYLKMIAGLKHFAGYSVEDGRGHRMFNISLFDLWDTYLKQYKYGFHPSLGNAGAAMCSYAGVNGVPSCANSYLLNTVVREHWKRPDAVIVSDCGAVANQFRQSQYASSEEDAAAKTVLGGTDVDLGDMYFSLPEIGGEGAGALYNATKAGKVPRSAIDAAVTRVLANRIRTGLFDPLDDQIYARYGKEDVNSTAHQSLVLDMTLQSLVLLKNDAGLLPLKEGVKLAVVGPHVYSQRNLFEDYAGDHICFNGSLDCVQTIASTFARLHGASYTRVEGGVDMCTNDTSNVTAALDVVRWSDVVVMFLGTGLAEEHEGIDRTDTKLPGIQEELALQVLAMGKPTVLVMINGGIVSIEHLVNRCDAIIEAFNPGYQGAHALYMAIFGHSNRWGRLPVTIYPASYVSEVDMYSFDMTKPPGRTYRYYTGTPLFSFGQGMSYTTFDVDCQLIGGTEEGLTAIERQLRTHVSPRVRLSNAAVVCMVTNTGLREGDDVLMLYHSAGEDIRSKVSHPVPQRSLVAFDRVSLAKGEKTHVAFKLSLEKLAMTSSQGDQVLYRGAHVLQVFDGSTWSEPLVVTVDAEAFMTVLEEVPKPRAYYV